MLIDYMVLKQRLEKVKLKKAKQNMKTKHNYAQNVGQNLQYNRKDKICIKPTNKMLIIHRQCHAYLLRALQHPQKLLVLMQTFT